VPVRDRDVALEASRPGVRAAAFAALAVPVSLAGHVEAGGSAPDDATLLLACALVVVGHRLVIAHRERCWPVLALALAATEFGLHHLFGLGAGGHLAMDAARSGYPHAAGGHAPSGAAMVAGHALAAVVLGWFARQGEAALWSAARRAAGGVHTGLRLIRHAVHALRALTALTAAPVPRAEHPDRAPILTLDPGRRRYLATGGRFWRGPPAAAATSTVPADA
jgi:hypothetical protein